jgi:hypothetical protein
VVLRVRRASGAIRDEVGLMAGHPLTEWDLRIIEALPYVQDLADTRCFDEAKSWLYDRLDQQEFTWKGPRFFFRDREAWMQFTMRWG